MPWNIDEVKHAAARLEGADEQVKRPVLELLERAGWQREGGLLSRLFGA